MPTEWERSSTSPVLGITVDTNKTTTLMESKNFTGMDKDMNGEMSTSTGSNSSTTASTNGHNGSSSNGGRKTSLTSPDPTAYVAKARVTRPIPPPPSSNPMQFVQIKPCNLYQTAQQQLKKAEEVKKIKEIQKEEPEEWQNNLDNWKSSRRKRVEHIIDRVVEVKKLELEEHDRSRRKSKTFSEMIEERGERGVRVGRAKLVSLAVYNEDESNDLSDLGIGTSSASGKSSVSEEYENNSVASDNADLEKAIPDINHPQNNTTREYISSPGYDTSSSTAPASSPDPCEYTYEGAIQDYKQRVSRATSGGSSGFKLRNNSNNQIKPSAATSKESTLDHHIIDSAPMEAYAARRGCKIEERLIGFEVSSPNDNQDLLEKNKVDLPKIDISKRKEIFECATSNNSNNEVAASNNEPKSHGMPNGAPRVTLRDNFKLEDAKSASTKKEVKRVSGEITSIKDRLQSLEQQNKLVNTVSSATKTMSTKISDTPVPPLKDRLSSLKNAATKEEIKKPPVVLIDARQLQIMKDEEEEHAKQRLLSKQMEVPTHTTDNTLEQLIVERKENELDRDDSGIHTSDDIEEDHISEQKLLQQTQEQQFNEAIAALAIEEQQLQQAANAVNNIEAEFAQLSNASNNQANLVGTSTTAIAATNEQPCEMEFSVSSTNNFLKTDPVLCKSSSSIDRNSSVSNVEIVHNKEVLGNHPSSGQTCSLSRKPSNEMVHARNLLKMFKETFNNDIQLDEEREEGAVGSVASFETKPISSQAALKSETAVCWPPSPLSHSTPTNSSSEPIKSQMFHASNKNGVDISSQVKEGSCPQSSTSFTAISLGTTSMIPRSLLSKGPMGKPPMSPKLPHSVSLSPTVNSPSPPLHKPDSQFSINGRVEIFNSKNMSDPTKPMTTPPMLPKKSYLPHPTSSTLIGSNKFTTSNNKPILLQSQLGNPSKTTEPSTVSNQLKSVDASEHQVMRSSIAITAPSGSPSPYDHSPEIVRCVSPINVVNPDELPKANTVKTLTSCFSNDHSKIIPTSPPTPPKPLPRSRINIAPQSTTLQSPRAEKRHFATDEDNQMEKKHETDNKTKQFKQLSIISSSSTNSSSSIGTAEPFETRAVVHSPPLLGTDNSTSSDPTHSQVSESQRLITCTPNDSTLYKLASSTAPSSPVSPHSPHQSGEISQTDIDFCKNFFSPAPLPEIPPQRPNPMRQQTVEEVQCNKVSIQDLSPNSHVPCTAWFEVTPDQVKRCDNQNSPSAPSTPVKSIRSPEKFEFAGSSKPNSPIMAARAAHSKALIETCEKIIAEERQARSQINSSLPTTPTSQKSTPILGRKSKIPKPIQCCIDVSDSMSKADSKKYESAAEQERDDEEGMLIARLHVVETQIKVTTTTPPASPKTSTRNKSHAQNSTQKLKTHNIFDFLKRNFGHHATTTDESKDVFVPSNSGHADTADTTTTFDEIITVDNSKFYIASEETSPPPLPLTPAPVSIEITKKITTDEILEESNSELALSQEINTMLDDEFNKLSLASVELKKE